jgi:hypothetical protein
MTPRPSIERTRPRQARPRRSTQTLGCTNRPPLMPCNAFNHPPDCNCGWGGKYYESEKPLDAPYWRFERSHTNPNAKCPVCAAAVFFYRSPDNGRVFFDSLGPPWPKHACTTSPIPRKLGWWPLLLDQILPLAEREGVALVDTNERMVLVRARWTQFRYDTPIWIQPVSGQKGMYRVSTLVTRRGVTRDREFSGIAVELLKDPNHAQHFQKTIASLNSRLT